MITPNEHIGSALDGFLEEEGLLSEFRSIVRAEIANMQNRRHNGETPQNAD